MSNLTDVKVIKDIVSRFEFKFSKGLGQNFLINPSVCPKMAEICGAREDSGVLEIGPGIGVLTRELAKRAKKVASIEIDNRLIAVLKETLAGFDNVTVVNDDVLKVDLHELIRREFSGMKVAVCANLPYYITTPGILRLLESRLPVDNITVMVQKEVAQRLCASPGTRESGAVTVAVNYFCEPSIAFYVSKGSFFPAPKVDSAVINLKLREKPAVEVPDEKLFFDIVKAGFAQRRKTLVNALKGGLGFDREAVEKALFMSGLSERVRIEELDLHELALLCNNLRGIIGGRV